MFLDGYQLIEVRHCADLVQARKHKKKRINKKWLKRYGMKEVPWNKFFVMGDKIYAHPTMIQRLKDEAVIHDQNSYMPRV